MRRIDCQNVNLAHLVFGVDADADKSRDFAGGRRNKDVVTLGCQELFDISLLSNVPPLWIGGLIDV